MAKSFKPSTKLLSAMQTVVTAEALVNTLRPVITAIQAEILDKNNFPYEDVQINRRGKSGAITAPSDAWMMSDVNHTEYCNQLQTAYNEAGFNVTDYRCPLLMAEDTLRKANRVLCDLSVEIHKIPYLNADNLIKCGIPKYNEALTATKQFLIQFI